jgi:hypothetical protein
MDYKTALEIINTLVEDCGGELAGEAWRTILVEPAPSASPNIQRDAILLLEEYHKKLRACQWWSGNLTDCSCLHCRVERFIAQNGTRL